MAISPEQKPTLEAWVRAPTSPQYVVRCARICLLAHQGWPNQRIAAHLGTSRPTVLLWRRRFAAGGPSVLEPDAPADPVRSGWT